MIVLDASAVLELLGRTPEGLRIEARLLVGEEALHAPHLLDAEVASALRRHCRLGSLSAARASEMLSDLAELRMIRHGHVPLLSRVWSLRQNFTSYDAIYLALAELLDATLITRDGALKSARLLSGRVEVL